MIEISIQDKVSPALLEAAKAFPGVVEMALDRGAQVIENEADRQIAKIAQRPIPRSSTGRPLWERTGQLAASRVRQAKPGQRVILWQAAYAEPRFALWVTRIPKNPAGGIKRKNNVPADTVRIVEPQIGAVVKQEIVNGLAIHGIDISSL